MLNSNNINYIKI